MTEKAGAMIHKLLFYPYWRTLRSQLYNQMSGTGKGRRESDGKTAHGFTQL